MAERARQRRTLAKVTSVVLAIGAVGAGGWFGMNAVGSRWTFEGLRPVARAEAPPSGTTYASADAGDRLEDPGTSSEGAVTPGSAATEGQPVVDSVSREQRSLVTAEAQDSATPAPAPIVPVIAEGRTELGDSVYAVRQGETVTVHFDTFLSRTRRRDKFDRIVRATLPRVYGAPADSLLASVPVGQIAQGGDLLQELPNEGISFELADGSTLALWPRTRPGRDGPLVVAYRATITR